MTNTIPQGKGSVGEDWFDEEAAAVPHTSKAISSANISVEGADYTVVRTDAETIFVYRGHDAGHNPREAVHPMSPVRRKVLAAYRAA